MKLTRIGLYGVAALSPVLLVASGAAANPTVGPIYGTPVTMDLTAINLTETINTDATGWVVSFDQYDQSGLAALYTVTTAGGDSCSDMTEAAGTQETCTVSLVNGDTSTPPVIDSVVYDPVVAMASGMNPGVIMMADGSSSSTSSTTTVPTSPVSFDVSTVTLTDNGDGTFTLYTSATAPAGESGGFVFTTSAGDSCTIDATAASSTGCTFTPSDGQAPVVTSLTWEPVVAVAYSAEAKSLTSATPSVLAVPNHSSPLIPFGIITALTTAGVLWLNARARRRRAE